MCICMRQDVGIYPGNLVGTHAHVCIGTQRHHLWMKCVFIQCF